MSWIITGSFAQPDEPEALAYIAAVEAADGQTLEDGVKFAYNSFIKGCKADGIWDAIKASCILAGARTLDGALVPLVGAAPTNFNFASEDYNRETGLVGDGSTKYLDSNRNGNVDLQNDRHFSVYASSASTFRSFARLIVSGSGTGGSSYIVTSNTGGNYVLGSSSIVSTTSSVPDTTTGFLCVNRNASTSFTFRANSINESLSSTTTTPFNENYRLYGRPEDDTPRFANARIAFYSIGESLDLALLDARVTTLISDLAAAIP